MISVYPCCDSGTLNTRWIHISVYPRGFIFQYTLGQISVYPEFIFQYTLGQISVYHRWIHISVYPQSYFSIPSMDSYFSIPSMNPYFSIPSVIFQYILDGFIFQYTLDEFIFQYTLDQISVYPRWIHNISVYPPRESDFNILSVNSGFSIPSVWIRLQYLDEPIFQCFRHIPYELDLDDQWWLITSHCETKWTNHNSFFGNRSFFTGCRVRTKDILKFCQRSLQKILILELMG